MAANSISFNNNNTWTAPNNDIVMVECWGAGGGGGSTNLAANASGGGGGGAYARANIQVVAGRVYTIQAPPGGANGTANANGTAGVLSQFAWNNTNNWTYYLRAAGGLGGRNNNAGGAGGTVANSFGDICFAGGAGAAGVAATGVGGGGGAGAGNANAGAAASGATPGAAANGGGKGANGGASGANATDNATAPGGGGGGSGNNTGTQRYGSSGKNGTVIITFADNATASGKVTLSGANLADARVMVMASTDNNAANSFLVGVATANAQGNWTMTVPSGKVISAVAQHNNATARYTSKATPFVAS
jgi:hypothetical protein